MNHSLLAKKALEILDRRGDAAVAYADPYGVVVEDEHGNQIWARKDRYAFNGPVEMGVILKEGL